jgi:hypothetical protein
VLLISFPGIETSRETFLPPTDALSIEEFLDPITIYSAAAFLTLVLLWGESLPLLFDLSFILA